MKERFCASCQQYRPESEGQIRKTKITRWICNICLERKAQSLYSSKGKEKHDYKRNVAGFGTRDYE